MGLAPSYLGFKSKRGVWGDSPALSCLEFDFKCLLSIKEGYGACPILSCLELIELELIELELELDLIELEFLLVYNKI